MYNVARAPLKRKTVTAMKQSSPLVASNAALARRARSVLARLPPLTGAPIRLHRVRGLRDRRGPVHAGSFLRRRRMVLDCTPAEFPRILVHELFHFVWLRAGNRVRIAYEEVLAAEIRAAAGGELGWSAEWRKRALAPVDIRCRTRRWREYCCESFCDSAAWLYAGVHQHGEFTLSARFSTRRRAWFHATFDATIAARGLSI